MKVVYLSGLMEGQKDNNFPQFDEYAERLAARADIIVVSPADLDRQVGLDGTRPLTRFERQAAFKRDIEVLLGCDLIAVMPGWERSRGARFEVEQMRLLGKDVVHADSLEPLDSFSIRAAREYAYESTYLGEDEPRPTITGGVPL